MRITFRRSYKPTRALTSRFPRPSFRSLLIIVGIFLSLLGKTNSATVSAGAGILGEFISAVFFYLYNQTIAKMADYHRKLVFTQNIGLALKISDGLPPDEKSQAQRALIDTSRLRT